MSEPPKTESKRERAEREAKEKLERADMRAFDQMMRNLISTSRAAPKKPDETPTNQKKDDGGRG